MEEVIAISGYKKNTIKDWSKAGLDEQKLRFNTKQNVYLRTVVGAGLDRPTSKK